VSVSKKPAEVGIVLPLSCQLPGPELSAAPLSTAPPPPELLLPPPELEVLPPSTLASGLPSGLPLSPLASV
jgi:hypothetical protein